MGGLVWLASYPKSGNTWTRNFLHTLLNHNAETPHDINDMNSRTAWDSGQQWYQPFLSKPMPECSRLEISKVRLQANAKIAEAAGKGFIFVKTHNAMVADCGVPMINPKVTAGAVYIIRNPLDVAVSYSNHLSLSIDDTIRFMARNATITNIDHPTMTYDVQGSWTENVFSWTREKNAALHIMRYEDMLDYPQRTFTALVKFLQIPATEQDIERTIELSSFEKLKAMEDETGFREKPQNTTSFFNKGKAGQWREALTETQIRQIISDHRTQMMRFHYIPNEYA